MSPFLVGSHFVDVCNHPKSLHHLAGFEIEEIWASRPFHVDDAALNSASVLTEPILHMQHSCIFCTGNGCKGRGCRCYYCVIIRSLLSLLVKNCSAASYSPHSLSCKDCQACILRLLSQHLCVTGGVCLLAGLHPCASALRGSAVLCLLWL